MDNEAGRDFGGSSGKNKSVCDQLQSHFRAQRVGRLSQNLPARYSRDWAGFSQGSLQHECCRFLIVPSEAQAQGMHGSLGVTAQGVVKEGSSTAVTLGDSEPSSSICISCCASSGCVAGSISEPFALSGAGASRSSIHVASTFELCQMDQHKVRRPPRQVS